MDFELSEEQRMLKSAARNLMEKDIIPVAIEQERKGPMTREEIKEQLKKLVPLGYICGPLAKEYGGQGLSWLSWGILLEELGRAWVSLGILTIMQFNWLFQLTQAGTREQKERYLGEVLSADRLVCHGLTEPNAGSNLAALQTSAIPDRDNWVLNGDKVFISGSPVAEWALILAAIREGKETGPNHRLFIVEREDSPYSVTQSTRLGLRSMPTGEISLQDCRVPHKNMLPEMGYKPTLIMLGEARSTTGAFAVGLAQAAIDATISYAKQREQFGRPIAKFQMIQGAIYDMVVNAEAARLLVYKSFDKLDRGERAYADCAIAKAFATEAAVRITTNALTVHGGYGLQDEYPIERYVRDAMTLLIPDGTPQIQRLIAAREILGTSAFV